MLFLSCLFFFLLSLAFSTIFERKILSVYNYRQGPSKTLFWGTMIPFSDFLKLFTKFFLKMFIFDYLFLNLFLGVFLFILTINFYPIFSSLFSFLNCFILIFLLYSIFVYYMFFLGWSTKSKYSYISSFRVLIQSISYEVGFVFSFLLILYLWVNFDLFNLSKNGFNFLIMLIYSFVWLIFIFSEMGRSPFDFIEGESELVSGFNIEFMGGLFSMIFLIEYGLMIIVSMLFSFLCLGSNTSFLLIFYFFCFVRCCFPRLRYDKMMYYFWKDYLIFILVMYLFSSLYF